MYCVRWNQHGDSLVNTRHNGTVKVLDFASGKVTNEVGKPGRGKSPVIYLIINLIM